MGSLVVYGEEEVTFDSLGPPGTPMTTPEVAEGFDCTARTIYNKLDALVDEGVIETKKVGARGRVWWRPASRSQCAAPTPSVPSEQAQLYDVIFNQTFQFAGLLEPDGTVIDVNEAALSFGKVDRDPIIGTPLWETPWWQVSEQRRTQLKQSIQRAADGETVQYEVEVRGDERTAVIDFSLRPVTDDHGEATFLFAEGRDISDLKERESQLKQERDLLDQILETSPVAIGVANTDREFTRMNERALDILGIPDEEADSYSPADRTVYTPDGERASVDDHPLSRTLATGESVYDWEAKIELPDGGYRWLSVNSAPVVDDTGKVEQVVTTGEDITRLKEQAESLEQQRNELKSRLEAVFERVDDGFYALDNDLRFTYINPHASEFLGRSEAELLGECIWDAFEVDLKADAAFQLARKTQQTVSFEVFYEPFGTWFKNHVYPSADGLSVYSTDMTERKEREKQLTTLNDLNEIVQEVTHLIIDSSTRQEVEEIVCDRLTASRSYDSAWIGQLDRSDRRVTPSTTDCDEDSRFDSALSLDEESSTVSGPISRAINTREVQIIEAHKSLATQSMHLRENVPSWKTVSMK